MNYALSLIAIGVLLTLVAKSFCNKWKKRREKEVEYQATLTALEKVRKIYPNASFDKVSRVREGQQSGYPEFDNVARQ